MHVRLRGIYATALTELFAGTEHTVVQPSDPIAERFDCDFPTLPADVAISMALDREGVMITGRPEAVDQIKARIDDISQDTFAWADPAPLGAVVDGTVDRTRGTGAILSLPGGAEGYLPFDEADGYVDIGDSLRVQVIDPRPPWSDQAPKVTTDISVPLSMLVLHRDRSDVRTTVDGEKATELIRGTELLSVSTPDNWGIEWRHSALDASVEEREQALDQACTIAEHIDTALAEAAGPDDQTQSIISPFRTAWAWFGRKGRFKLDEFRREVHPTMAGHHRIKAGTEQASAAVDFVESLCSTTPAEFPTGLVIETFGPSTGDTYGLYHGKPDGRRYDLGPGTVTDISPPEKITVQREISSHGTYDALGTERQPGDIAVTKLAEGREWYPTSYRGAEGKYKGTYVNICTPVELFPDGARYMDLHVDVIKRPDGEVTIVDTDELDAAVESGSISPALAERAREVAQRVKRGLQ